MYVEASAFFFFQGGGLCYYYLVGWLCVGRFKETWFVQYNIIPTRMIGNIHTYVASGMDGLTAMYHSW